MNVEDYGWADEAPESSGYINPAVLKLLKENGATSVLDAGCGNGELCGLLAKSGFDVTGIDADRRGIEIAKNRYPGAKFSIGSFESDPVVVGVDAVVSTEVVEHLYSPHLLARHAFAALKPGGVFIISTPYHSYLKNLALAVTNKWDAHHTALWHGGHIKFWSYRTLNQLLGQAGFKPASLVGVGRLPFLWKSMILVAQRPVSDEGS